MRVSKRKSRRRKAERKEMMEIAAEAKKMRDFFKILNRTVVLNPDGEFIGDMEMGMIIEKALEGKIPNLIDLLILKDKLIQEFDEKVHNNGVTRWREYTKNPTTGEIEKVYYTESENTKKKRMRYAELLKKGGREMTIIKLELEEVSLMEELKKPDLNYAKDMNAQIEKMREVRE